jgi:hypothetical protein
MAARSVAGEGARPAGASCRPHGVPGRAWGQDRGQGRASSVHPRGARSGHPGGGAVRQRGWPYSGHPYRRLFCCLAAIIEHVIRSLQELVELWNRRLPFSPGYGLRLNARDAGALAAAECCRATLHHFIGYPLSGTQLLRTLLEVHSEIRLTHEIPLLPRLRGKLPAQVTAANFDEVKTELRLKPRCLARLASKRTWRLTTLISP